MMNAINEATHNFFTNIIGIDAVPAKSVGKDFYGAAVALQEDQKETQFYLLFKRNTLHEFSKALLFEDNLNEDDLNDLIKEVANLIIGSAKVILEKNNPNIHYKIATPDFLGHIPTPKLLKLEDYLLYKVKNTTFLIGKKTMDISN